MGRDETLIVEQICGSAMAALLRYANEERDLSQRVELERFVSQEGSLGQILQERDQALRQSLRQQPDLRYGQLLRALEKEPGGQLARRTFELCLLEHCCPVVTTLLDALQEAPGCTGVSLELVLQIYFCGDLSTFGAVASNYGECLDAFGLLEPFLQVASDPQACYRRRLTVDQRLVGWLVGDDRCDGRLEGAVVFYPYRTAGEALPPLFDSQALASQLVQTFQREGSFTLLRGEEGSGRRLLLRHAAALLGRNLLLVDCRRLMGGVADMGQLIWYLRREAILTGSLLGWHHLEGAALALDDFMRLCVDPMAGLSLSQCLCSDLNTQLGMTFGRPFFQITILPFDRLRRIGMWEGFTRLAGLELDCVKYGATYRLRPAEIERVVQQLLLIQKNGEEMTDAMVSQACMDVLPLPSQGSLRCVQAGYRFEDLKLAPAQKQNLLNICAHVWQSHTVFDTWKLERRFPYGRGVTALFSGPPGTGKTMAAQILSELVELPLYRVELSQVVDKYIGETEKKLEEIFSLAEKSNTILFFDEADALFGKRSEVNDAKDKYANTEVSYILQRIEQYDGVIILATNFKRNIDEAFMRRMRYVVEFLMPNREIRQEIWESCFSPETPLEGIDFEFLADRFEFSGGSIKNIALNAAFLAANEGKPIGMQHLLEGIRSENSKFGRVMQRSDFGIYGSLLP